MKKQKLKFLLIHPEISRTKYNFVGIIENECLELEYVSAILKSRNYDVKIYDGQVEKITVLDTIKKYSPNFVYICGRTRQENFMLEYCKMAKKNNNNTITIIGGLHAQLSYERMYNDNVDFILSTFDYYKILDIIDCCLKKNFANLNKIDGICYKKNNKWQKNKSVAFDIKKLPPPDRSYFYSHPNNYRYLELEHSSWVRTSFCCPYSCKFCNRNKMNNGVYSARDIEDVVKEIKNIKSDNIYIVDDDFLFDAKRVEKFIELIKKYNIRKKYICYGRSDFIANNENIMKKFKDVGLYYVLVGLEAIDDKNLESYNKKSNVSNNIKSIEICNKYGINIMGMFILDLDFTKKDFDSLYKWIKKHNLKHVAISIFTPEFGTLTYDKYKDRLITDNPSHWDYLHLVSKPSKISVKRYYFYYYVLLIKLFLKAKKDGIYDFIDYKDYINSFIMNIFKSKRSNDDE